MKTSIMPETEWNFEHNFIVFQALSFCQKEIEHYKSLIFSKGHSFVFEEYMSFIQTALKKQNIPSILKQVLDSKGNKLGAVVDCGGNLWSPMGIDGIDSYKAFYSISDEINLYKIDSFSYEKNIHNAVIDSNLELFSQFENIDSSKLLYTKATCDNENLEIPPLMKKGVYESQGGLEQLGSLKINEYLNDDIEADEFQLKIKTSFFHELESFQTDNWDDIYSKIKFRLYLIENEPKSYPDEQSLAKSNYFEYIKKTFNELYEKTKDSLFKTDATQELLFYNNKARDYQRFSINLENQEQQQKFLEFLSFPLLANITYYVGYIQLDKKFAGKAGYVGDYPFIEGNIFNLDFKKQNTFYFYKPDKWNILIEELYASVTVNDTSSYDIPLSEFKQFSEIPKLDMELIIKNQLKTKSKKQNKPRF